MASEEQKKSESESTQSYIFSPRFKSVAAMAGWDEETLLSASLIVDDTPDRELNQKKRVVLQFKTPPSTDSRKKRRVQRSPVPIVALDLNEAGPTKNETKKDEKEEKKESKGDLSAKKNVAVSGSSASLLCMDKLREELACAICLDVCFEPSTTPCGHSFCLKCLRLAASKCEKKCPKCRQLIGNGRSCTVNTVLWNTIQLLFPEEVEAKKAAGALNSREAKDRKKIPESAFYDSLRNESPRDSEIQQVEETTTSRRRRVSRSQSEEDDPIAGLLREIRSINRASRASSRRTPTQDEDAAMALRLQREEVVRSTNTTRLNNRSSSSAYNRSVSLASNSETTSDQSRGRGRSRSSSSSSSFSLARENLRAMASIASNRVRSWNF